MKERIKDYAVMGIALLVTAFIYEHAIKKDPVTHYTYSVTHKVVK